MLRLGLAIAALAALLATPAARAAPITIVAVGASNTSGFYVATESAYPAQLEAMLRAKGVNARVINAGRPFDTTASMLSRLDQAVPDGTNIAILQPGGAVYCWSGPTYGSGYGTSAIALPGAAQSIAAGDHHACAVLTDASVWCWGHN